MQVVPQSSIGSDEPTREGVGFSFGKMIEAGDRVAAEVILLDPEWSGPVTLFRVFTFRPVVTRWCA